MAIQKFTSKASLVRIEKILEILSSPMTVPEVRALVFLSKPTMNHYIYHLHEKKMVHISGWKRESVAGEQPYLRPIYRAGEGKDRPKPKAFTHTQNSKRRYHRLKRDNPEALDKILAKGRLYKRMMNFKPRPDIAAAWLFGNAA